MRTLRVGVFDRGFTRTAARALLVPLTFACSTERGDPSDRGAPGVEEKSPTAKILPEPLASGADRERNEKAQRPPIGSRRGRREAFPSEQPLPSEAAPKSSASPFSFTVTLAGFRAFSAEEDGDRDLVLEGTLLPESEGQPTRQTLRLSKGPWPLPVGTEFRSSADRLGWLVVWPDGRSYRVVPEGALLGVFAERRVDGMPRYDAQVEPRAAQATSRAAEQRVESPLGTLTLSLAVLPELGDGGHLLCDVLMEFLRARREPELCGVGEFPVTARYEWARGGSLELSLSPPRRKAEAQTSEFRIPPDLPIWKPGELPPEATFFPPGETIPVTNQDEIPLFFEVRGGGSGWLSPGTTRSFVTAGQRLEYRARDFRGRLLLSGSVASPAARGEGLSLAGPDVPAEPGPRSP